MDEVKLHVNYVMGPKEGEYLAPGHFITSLIKTIALADFYNRMKLMRSFPEYTIEVSRWYFGEDYAEGLVATTKEEK